MEPHSRRVCKYLQAAPTLTDCKARITAMQFIQGNRPSIRLVFSDWFSPGGHVKCGVSMAHLVFRCPNTGRELDSGLDEAQADVSLVHDYSTRIRCPFCGRQHKWEVAQSKSRFRGQADKKL